jgi:hypothetical protein
MCVVAVKYLDKYGWVGAKNRDRNYIVTIDIVRSNRGGVQRMYIDDQTTRWTEGINEYGWKDTNDLKQFLDTDGMDHSLWEKTLTIPYRYNRLILFRPWMFHSPGPLFGDTIDTARVIQTFFWS